MMERRASEGNPSRKGDNMKSPWVTFMAGGVNDFLDVPDGHKWYKPGDVIVTLPGPEGSAGMIFGVIHDPELYKQLLDWFGKDALTNETIDEDNPLRLGWKEEVKFSYQKGIKA